VNRITIGPAGDFCLGGSNFVIDMSARGRRPSDANAFTIVKGEQYLRFYDELASWFSPRSILELGVFQGGGYVFLDKLFAPQRMSAVDINSDPVPALSQYVTGLKDRYVHFSTSQSKSEALQRIVRDELADQLDLVVDDASHTYELTKASFELLFPLLQPAGIYVIEDWGWAHQPAYQDSDAPFANRNALSNLVFEQIMLMASTALIAEVRVLKPLYMIRKAANAPCGFPSKRNDCSSIFDQIRSRGRGFTPI
jgi:predicted O-methyltransferase YrrM